MFHEVLREETRLSSHCSLPEETKIFLAQSEPSQTDEAAFLTARGQKPQCFECKRYGHACCTRLPAEIIL